MIRPCIAVIAALAWTAFGPVLAQAEQKTSYLFVQDADEVTITPVPGEQSSYQLTLAGVGPEIVYFADQPQRKAGMIDQADFMAVFAKEHGKKIQPNAALVWSTPERGALVVKLAKGSYSSEDKTAVYRATVLKTAGGGLAELNSRKATESVPSRLGKVMLFIDDFGCNPFAGGC